MIGLVVLCVAVVGFAWWLAGTGWGDRDTAEHAEARYEREVQKNERRDS